MAGPLIEMVVESVRVHMLSSQHVVILKESDADRYLPIWIGPWEANAIAMKLQGLAPERPLTHDLFARTLEELGVVVREVVITDLADDTFHARLFLGRGERTIEIDSRPSDALALAVRAGARSTPSRRSWSGPACRRRWPTGIDTEEELGDDGARFGARAGAGRGADRIVDPRLDVFRDFINSLGTDQDGASQLGRAAAGGLRRRVGSPGPRRGPSRRIGSSAAQRALAVRPHPQAQEPEVADGAEDDLRLGPGRRAGRARVVRARRPRRPSGRAARSLISSSAEKNAPPDSTRTPSSAARRNSLQAQSTSRDREAEEDPVGEPVGAGVERPHERVGPLDPEARRRRRGVALRPAAPSAGRCPRP